MKFTAHGALKAAGQSLGRALIRRPLLLAALLGATLALGLSGQLPGDAKAAASGQKAQEHRVGHQIKRITVPGSAQGEPRAVDVHLWYPADVREFSDAPETVYKSALYGKPLIPDRWDPLSWTVDAEIARETAAIDSKGQALPVIVFSHGSVNDPIDYAHTLERIAGAGFVVAAPSHVNNTQDDVRRDYINGQAGRTLFPCEDGRPGPCSRTSVPRSMQDRVRDISKVLDELPGWLGNRVDVSRAGILGHSRGTVTALAAAGGSTSWGFGAEPRVKAIMGLAIGAPAITFGANVKNVTVPSLLVAGGQDRTSRPEVSEQAYNEISSDEKAFVSIKNATHRSFDSTYCDQTQAAGAIAQKDPRAILDRHTIAGIVTAPTSGKAMEYCSSATFTDPTDIRPLVASLTGEAFPPNVPTTGLETEEVKQGVKELAATFFGTVLKRTGNDGPHFTRYLAPKWLERHEPMVDRAEAEASADAICPPGQEVDCADEQR